MKEEIQDIFYYIVIVIITFSIGYLFISLLPIWDCGYQVADYSCTVWGWKP